ncbi:hypothetical protein ACBJ59_10980 [Nonomuraea sp. MTCD27]|uniref:hypothetical protein n=1 Tax=Nonomuraea sp. MTCD27 TaxID=1676747 RepID=UPI0035C15C87
MTMQLHDTVEAEVVEETDPVTATIRHNATQERQQADRFAADASRHRQEAKRLEDLAMECRLREQRWRRLLDLETVETGGLLGDPIDDQGSVQTVLFPRQRTRYPLVHLNGSDTPHLACAGCGKALREATAAEAEAITGGRQIPPQRCNACVPDGGNPYPPAA